VFQQLFHSIPNFAEWGRAWMSNELFQFKLRSVSIITDSATDRYKALVQNQSQIILQAPLKCIATYLGITDSSLSRIRKEISA
jgi:CRP/FNR family transcriptional regulator, anaerobic regulatory protein